MKVTESVANTQEGSADDAKMVRPSDCYIVADGESTIITMFSSHFKVVKAEAASSPKKKCPNFITLNLYKQRPANVQKERLPRSTTAVYLKSFQLNVLYNAPRIIRGKIKREKWKKKKIFAM